MHWAVLPTGWSKQLLVSQSYLHCPHWRQRQAPQVFCMPSVYRAQLHSVVKSYHATAILIYTDKHSNRDNEVHTFTHHSIPHYNEYHTWRILYKSQYKVLNVLPHSAHSQKTYLVLSADINMLWDHFQAVHSLALHSHKQEIGLEKKKNESTGWSVSKIDTHTPCTLYLPIAYLQW